MRFLIDLIFHFPAYWTYWTFLKKSQFWDKETMKEWQFNKISKLWDYAVIHVPYYKRIADEMNLQHINSWEDFYKIPVLTKDIVRANFNDLIADNISAKRIIKNSTSGSTGSNFYFYSDVKQGLFVKKLRLRKYRMMGVHYANRREMVIWGSSFDTEKIHRRRFDKLKRFLENTVYFSEYDLSHEGMAGIFRKIETFRPKSLQSYPSILMRLAEYAEANNIDVSVPVIHTGGEKTYEFQRTKIEKVFKCRLYDFYGGRDAPMVGMSCRCSNKIHIFQEGTIFEVVDKQRKNIKEGIGDILITNLHNYVMPLIRYEIGDQAKVSTDIETCECGMKLQQVDEIIGRKFETLEFGCGKSVGGTFWTLLLRSINGIKDFQVVQEGIDVLKISYVSEDTYDPSKGEIENVISVIHQYCGDNVTVSFEKVDMIPLTKAGKKQFVLSKVH